jgi:glycine/D-amino acid oxidase-like deaminating enzyme/nitrite reductase/ring-hydroxylating ferredoxin subunit
MSKRKGKQPTDAGLRGSGKTATAWTGVNVFKARPLDEELDVDVCVLGAGVAGLTTAYRLASEGLSVVVLEAGELGVGETARSTAHLSTALGQRYRVLEDLHGEPAARLIFESHAAAITFVEEVVRDEELDCGFSRLNGYLFWPSDADLRALDEEQAACDRAGAHAQKLESSPIPSWNSGPCLKFSGQAQLDPLRYLSGLARSVTRLGAKIFTRSRGEILPGPGLRVRAAKGLIKARFVVVATNSPVDDGLAFTTRQAAYRTYALSAEAPPAAFPEPLLLWDTLDPYHYARLIPAEGEGTISQLIVGGEDHKVGHANDARERWDRLEAWARARFPMLGAVSRRWSGQVQESADGIGFAGRHPGEERAVFVITGDCGNGMTHGTLGAILVADLIQGRANDWAAVYDPARLTAGAAQEMAAENLDSMSTYLRYASGGDADSEDAIPPGCGAVVRRGMAPVAVYRGEDGELVERSAICPHMGGLVCWNQGERTWDCPAHGSRFSPSGEPVCGPANEALGTPENPLPKNPMIGAWLSPPPPL